MVIMFKKLYLDYDFTKILEADDSEILHIGANAGMHNKHTLQVSGFLL